MIDLPLTKPVEVAVIARRQNALAVVMSAATYSMRLPIEAHEFQVNAPICIAG